MHKAFSLFISASLIVMLACNSEATDEKGKITDTVAVNAGASADQLDVSKTDSIELLQFPDPANQKIYNRNIVKDTVFIRHITNYVLDTAVQKNPCANDYKMFLFRNGDVYKTIYAATSDSCRYFAYVINGVTHFTGLNDSAVALLKNQVKH